MIYEYDAAYLAGLIDGEGCITVAKRTTAGYALALRLAMCDETLVRWCHSVTGVGSVAYLRSRNIKHRDSWVWSCGSRQASVVLRQILPYLKLKRTQAELFIELTEIRMEGHGRKSERQAEIVSMFKLLNKRGA